MSINKMLCCKYSLIHGHGMDLGCISVTSFLDELFYTSSDPTSTGGRQIVPPVNDVMDVNDVIAAGLFDRSISTGTSSSDSDNEKSKENDDEEVSHTNRGHSNNT